MKKHQRKQNHKEPTQPAAGPRKPARAALLRHERKCTVCHHPERELIEREFFDWHSCRNIARAHKITYRSLYRHVDALELRARRGDSVRFSLSHILEQAANVPINANSLIDAVRVFSHLTDDGTWFEPPRRTIIYHAPQQAVSNRHASPRKNSCNSIKTHA